MDKDKNFEENRLRSYDDPSGVSWREMHFGLWVAEHRRLITRAVTVFLILISAFFFIYSTYAYIIYFMRGPIDNQPENQVVSPRNVVDNPVLEAVKVLSRGDDYDLAVKITNPNDNFWADFSYCFYQGGNQIGCDKSFLLPAEEKQIMLLGSKITSSAGVTFKIEDIFWSRLNRREIPDWPLFLAERTDFVVSNVEFLNANKSGLSELVKFNTLEFSIYNHSAYNYFEAPLEILFYSGSQLVGVERHLINNFMAGETRKVKISWPGDIGNVDDIKITPRIHILKSDVYLRYGSY